jgi:hypothetical protein
MQEYTKPEMLTQPKQNLLHLEQALEAILVDMQVREVQQKVIPHEDCEENEIVDNGRQCARGCM